MVTRVLVAFTMLLALCGLCSPPCSAASNNKPKSTVRFVSCASVDTIKTKKEVCYVYDLEKKSSVVQVTIAAGLNINVGTVIFGGSARAVMEVVIEFPLSTVEGKSNEEIAEKAEAQFQELLKEDETKKKAKEVLGEDVIAFGHVEANACYAKDPNEDLKKILEALEN